MGKYTKNYEFSAKKRDFLQFLYFFSVLLSRLFDVFGEFETANVFAKSYHQDSLRRAEGGSLSAKRGGQSG